MFARARTFANLTPFERAVLRFIETLALSALVAGWQAIAPLLTNPDPRGIPWLAVLHTFIVTVALSALSALTKYARAFGDPPLPTAGPSRDVPSQSPLLGEKSAPAPQQDQAA